MNVNEVISILGNFGFPILVSVYLLMRLEKKIEELTNAINDFQRAMDRISK